MRTAKLDVDSVLAKKIGKPLIHFVQDFYMGVITSLIWLKGK